MTAGGAGFCPAYTAENNLRSRVYSSTPPPSTREPSVRLRVDSEGFALRNLWLNLSISEFICRRVLHVP